MEKRRLDVKKYGLVFIITAAIFSTAFFASNTLNDRRIEEVRAIEDRIAINLLSLETQFDLLRETPCEVASARALSEELNALAEKLEYTERILPPDAEELIQLKKQYSLFQIKDYLLMRKLKEQCGIDSAFILYFYSNTVKCELCARTGAVLTRLRERYPLLRVYSFDYHLDLSAVATLISIYDIKDELPALVFDKKVYYGLADTESIEELLPEDMVQEYNNSLKEERGNAESGGLPD